METEAQRSDWAHEEDNKLQSFVETQLFWAHDLSTTPGSSWFGDLRRAKACFCQILGLVGWGSSSKAQVLESRFYLGQVSNL